MQANQLLTADMLDILFDGKNKAYGAYNLRKTYNNRLLKSMLILLSLLALLVTSFFVYAGRKVTGENFIPVTPEIFLKDLPADADPVPPPPPPAPMPPEHIRTVANTNIVIVTEDVPEDQKPPTQEDLTNARISNITTDGQDDDHLTGPTSNVHGIETGVVSAPSKNEKEDKPFFKVEIESQYIGGAKAWSRFLYKNLGNNYPSEAFDKGIEGTVVIQFIVDREGLVSNVEAISGPEELREAAITTIKKSGKWEPAQQNGNKVKSYKRQPITFMLNKD